MTAAHVDARPANPRLGRLSLVLGAGGLIHLVISLSAQALTDRVGLSAATLSIALLNVSPLLIAASIAAGWGRWPSARAWLASAVASWVVSAALNAASRILLVLA